MNIKTLKRTPSVELKQPWVRYQNRNTQEWTIFITGESKDDPSVNVETVRVFDLPRRVAEIIKYLSQASRIPKPHLCSQHPLLQIQRSLSFSVNILKF